MADKISLDIKGLDELKSDINKVQKTAPDYLQTAIRRAGNKLKKMAVEETKQRTKYLTKKGTGNLAAGYRSVVEIKKGTLSTYEAKISGGNKKAHHFHLLEHGHRRYNQYFPRPNYSGGGVKWIEASAGYTDGLHMMKAAREDFESKEMLTKEAQWAIDKALKEGLI